MTTDPSHHSDRSPESELQTPPPLQEGGGQSLEKGQIHQSVSKWVWAHHLLVISTLTLYGIHVFWLAGFYANVHTTGDFAPVFRWSMVSVVAFVFVVSNIVARTHGSRLSGIDIPAVVMSFSCLLVLTAMPPQLIPISSMVVFFTYVLTRKDNRKRLIVFVTVITMGTLALALSAWFTDIIYQGFFGGILTGAGTAYIIRLMRTFQSGGVFKFNLQSAWKNYDDVKDSLKTFDIILESESKSSASRLTALWSRSAWTHSALIVRRPSDEIKTLYGVPTQGECLEELTKIDRELTAWPRQQQVNDAGKTQADLRERHRQLCAIHDEELFVFEAVRPVVELNPLRLWMENKESQFPYKVIVVNPLEMYQGRAKVELDMNGLNEVMQNMHGVEFVDDPKYMIRANYQLNRDKDTQSVFCSELIAMVYQRVGLLSESREASNFTPNDFWPGTRTPLLVDARLVDGYRLRSKSQPKGIQA